MDLELIGGSVIGLAWRLGRTPRARAVLALIYWLIGGIICAGTAGVVLALSWLSPGSAAAPDWLALAMGAAWCLVVGLVFWRLRRYEW